MIKFLKAIQTKDINFDRSRPKKKLTEAPSLQATGIRTRLPGIPRATSLSVGRRDGIRRWSWSQRSATSNFWRRLIMYVFMSSALKATPLNKTWTSSVFITPTDDNQITHHTIAIHTLSHKAHITPKRFTYYHTRHTSNHRNSHIITEDTQCLF